jgi:uncharacterized protein YegP (UPF0339 family)
LTLLQWLQHQGKWWLNYKSQKDLPSDRTLAIIDIVVANYQSPTTKENMMKRKPYYEVYQGTDNKWRWRQVAANGQKTAASGEPFVSKRNAVRAIATHAKVAYQAMFHSVLTVGYIKACLLANNSIRFQEEGREVVYNVWSK